MVFIFQIIVVLLVLSLVLPAIPITVKFRIERTGTSRRESSTALTSSIVGKQHSHPVLLPARENEQTKPNRRFAPFLDHNFLSACAGEINGQIRGDWLFGLVRFRIPIPGPSQTEPLPKRNTSTRKSKRKTGRDTLSILPLLRQSTFRNRVVRFAKDILRATHGRNLYLRLRIGLGDPADTGRLWALVGPVAGIAANIESAKVHLEPEFMESVFTIESHGTFRLIPLQIIFLTIVFMLSPTILPAWRTFQGSNG